MDAISRLLKPQSVAVIGASADASKTAGRPVAYLVKHGFAGAIYPINPKVDCIGDLTCYPNVASLPEVPDVGIVLLGAERAHLAVRDLAACSAAAAIVLASGYAETGEQGPVGQSLRTRSTRAEGRANLCAAWRRRVAGQWRRFANRQRGGLGRPLPGRLDRIAQLGLTSRARVQHRSKARSS